jgi:glutathione transport system substrate-binding protein
MKAKAKRWSLLALIAIMAFVFAACSSSSNNTSSSGGNSANTGSSSGSSNTGSGSTSKDSITIAINQNFLTLDPHNTSDTHSITAVRTMYEGLVGFDENMNVVPLLAENWDVSEDGLVYTFHLRSGIKFHDGADFNAEAVKLNIERAMNPDNNVRFSRFFTKVASIETPDANTIVITMSEPYAPFLNKMAMFLIISPNALGNAEKLAQGVAAGTGPYKFVQWVSGDRLDLERNDEYWGEGPKVSKVTFKPVPENGARMAMLQTGEADFIYPFPTEQVEKAEGDANIVLDRTDSTIARYVTLNILKKPFDDIRVRQALNHAIDKDAYIKVVKSGLGTYLSSTMSAKTQYYSEQPLYEYNPEKAKQLLAEAGYPDGFKVTLWGESESETVKGMQFIAQQLAEIGVEVEVQAYEGATLGDMVYTPPEENKVEMWYVSWSPSSGDADGATRSLFHSDYWPPAGPNTAFYKNDQVDAWIDEANATSDTAKAAAIYADIQKQIYADAPWLFMGVDQIISGKRANVEGIKVYPDGSINLRQAELK